MSQPKQVIVVRKDLNMRKGKMISQCCHASLGVVLNCMNDGDDGALDILDEWMHGTHKKVCVYVNSEQELLDVYAHAMSSNVNVKLVEDLGLTEFNGVKTLTCLAVGPGWDDDINPITGHLPLL